MSKSQNSKQNAKKAPAKTLKEKQAAKREKKAQKGSMPIVTDRAENK